MLYLLLIITTIIIVVLLLHIRMRVNFNSEKWLLFIGLGQSGPEYDFISKTGRLNLFGLAIKSFKRAKRPKEKPEAKPPPIKPKKKAKRKRPLRDLLRIIPRCSQALGIYFISLLKAVIVEELEGEVEAGFESPDITGTVYGYYQAALAAAPAVMGRIRYTPNWDKASFDASFRAAIAIPLYKIILQTIILIIKLPLRDLIKLAIGKKKGAQDGQ